MKKVWITLPLIALLAAACAQQNQNTQAPTPQQQTTQQNQLPETNNPSLSSSSSGATSTPVTDTVYTNSTYGYQFTYSNEYILEANNPKKVGVRNKSDKSTDIYGNKIPADVTIEYFGDLTQLPNYKAGMKDVNDYVAQSGSAKLMYNITSHKNKDGDLVYAFTDTGLLSIYTELIPHNGHVYQISYFKRETGDKLNSKEKQIQESFKFIK